MRLLELPGAAKAPAGSRARAVIRVAVMSARRGARANMRVLLAPSWGRAAVRTVLGIGQSDVELIVRAWRASTKNLRAPLTPFPRAWGSTRSKRYDAGARPSVSLTFGRWPCPTPAAGATRAT